MSQLPIHEQYKREGRVGQGEIWEALKFCDTWQKFSVSQLDLVCNCNRTTIRGYIRRLESAGLAEYSETDAQTRVNYYRLLAKPEGDAPSIRKDGTLIAAKPSVNQSLWNSMRKLKIFCARDIYACASTKLTPTTQYTVNQYIKALQAGGYIVRISGGEGRMPATYKLVNDTGPIAPKIQKTVKIYDPNTQGAPHE